MKHLIIAEKWKSTGIVTIGGILIGAGLADCLFAMNQLDLNQIARGLTVFSAGLTILVIMDNSKTQKNTEKIQQEAQVQLEKVAEQLQAIHQSQQITEEQVREIKELLNKSDT
ncbi:MULTISPECIES: hypothetical protein [unclassified Paenibacillus]|uniref:hypothetical protein n=1 Tax=unclassified Paenibacillus TaxID=185978 RepID=UPI000838CD50|nr:MULTISPECIES: hypothetical protein [unclassified Paenibacillus]NWL86064.1 hypothetical protein [Paenibacillus sp. 79R4]